MEVEVVVEVVVDMEAKVVDIEAEVVVDIEAKVVVDMEAEVQVLKKHIIKNKF
jgi:hypothetical protein